MKTIAGFVFLGIALITCGAASHTDGCDTCGGGYRAYTSYAPAMMVAPAMPCATCTTTAYRLICQTVYDQRQVVGYRIENETVYQERKVTSYHPVTETQLQERRYMVAKPIYETAEREERYTVMKPVYETQIVDRSYDQVRNVNETSEREERYVVARPVYETAEREQRYMVQRPVMETAERDQYSTVCEPQTTYTTRYADMGAWQEYQVAKPGPVYNQPVCVPGGCSTDPCTGLTTYIAPTTGYQQVQAPATVEVHRAWKPNIVAEQIPQTTYVQKVVVQKVPVQVCRYVNEEVVQKIPYTICRMVQEEQVRKVPVTVCRQVVEHVDNKVPVQVCKMVPEEMVRKIPVTTCKLVNEERVDQVPVQVCKMVAVEETVRVPQCVQKQIPVTYTYRVPRTVVMRVPVDPCTGAALAVTTTVPTMIQQSMPGMQGVPAMPPAPGSGSVTPSTTFGNGSSGNGEKSVMMPPAPKEGAEKGTTGSANPTEKKSDRESNDANNGGNNPKQPSIGNERVPGPGETQTPSNPTGSWNFYRYEQYTESLAIHWIGAYVICNRPSRIVGHNILQPIRLRTSKRSRLVGRQSRTYSITCAA